MAVDTEVGRAHLKGHYRPNQHCEEDRPPESDDAAFGCAMHLAANQRPVRGRGSRAIEEQPKGINRPRTGVVRWKVNLRN